MLSRTRRLLWLAVPPLAIACAVAALGLRAAWLEERTLHPPRKPVPSVPREKELAGLSDVVFSARGGPTLKGWYLPSHNGAAVVLAHGHGGNRAQLVPEFRALARAGFGVLAFDWRAHGESGGEVSTWGQLEQEDLKAALDFACARKDVDPRRVGVLGFSVGAAVAVEVASRDPRVAALVLTGGLTTLEEATRYDMRGWGWLSQEPALWLLSLRGIEVASVRPIDKLCQLSPRPVLIVDGDRDTTEPSGQGERLFAAACEPKQLFVAHGAGHGEYALAAGGEYERRVVDHFKAALLGSSP